MVRSHPRDAPPFREASEAVTPSQRLVRVDLNEQAYTWLRERIVTRQFGPGERLALQGLADELGVSRSPVHQALTRLVSDGLVTVSRRGYAVRPVTIELVRDSLDARLALELFAARSAAVELAPERLARLRELLAATLAPVEDQHFVDKPAYLDANRAFHEALVDLPGNDVISEMYRRLNVHQLVDRAILGLPGSDAGPSTEEHTEIVEAIASGDVERAQAAVAANVATGRRLTLAAVERAGGVL
jgi:DNA-binding GntR family transcriptional regulator